MFHAYDDLGTRGNNGVDGLAVRGRISNINQSRRKQAEDVAQFAEIRGNERIGGRDGSEGDAGVHCAEPEQGLFDVVAG